MIVGADNVGGPYYDPVQWKNGQISVLAKLPEFETESYYIERVSGDGTLMLARYGNTALAQKIILWTNGVPELLMETSRELRFCDTTPDMRTLVFTEVTDVGLEGIYTTEESSWNLVSLHDLVESYGVDRMDYRIVPTAISSAGRTIVGYA